MIAGAAKILKAIHCTYYGREAIFIRPYAAFGRLNLLRLVSVPSIRDWSKAIFARGHGPSPPLSDGGGMTGPSCARSLRRIWLAFALTSSWAGQIVKPIRVVDVGPGKKAA